MASPQKGFLPKNGFSPKMTSPLKIMSPQKMAFSRNIFVGSLYISNDSDKPKLKEDYHHSTSMSSKYVLALFCLNVETFCAGCYVLIVEEIIDHDLKENI